MRIFVSGQEGQIARSLAALDSTLPDLVVIRAGRPGFDLVDPDAAQATAIASAPDVIVNAAAYTSVEQAETEPELALRINRDGAAAMARAARHLGVPIIQISTDYVFSGAKLTPYMEADKTGPVNSYGASKLAGEITVSEISPLHVILRTSWVYSPYGKNFIKTMVQMAGHHDSLRIVSDQTGCPTSASDFAEAVVKICRELPGKRELSGTYHMAGTGEATWAQFAGEIFSFLSSRGEKVPRIIPTLSRDYKTVATRPLNSRLDCSKLEKTFNIKLPHWRESVATCLQELTIDKHEDLAE